MARFELERPNTENKQSFTLATSSTDRQHKETGRGGSKISQLQVPNHFSELDWGGPFLYGAVALCWVAEYSGFFNPHYTNRGASVSLLEQNDYLGENFVFRLMHAMRRTGSESRSSELVCHLGG